MTQEQAANIITKAIAAEGRIKEILGADAFAARLAIALEALGLLEFAHVDAAPIADTGAKAPAPDRIAEGVAWASQRDRSR